MKAYYVDSGLAVYDIVTIEVDDDFNFTGQYKKFKTLKEAQEELRAILNVDIGELKVVLSELE